MIPPSGQTSLPAGWILAAGPDATNRAVGDLVQYADSEGMEVAVDAYNDADSTKVLLLRSDQTLTHYKPSQAIEMGFLAPGEEEPE